MYSRGNRKYTSQEVKKGYNFGRSLRFPEPRFGSDTACGGGQARVRETREGPEKNFERQLVGKPGHLCKRGITKKIAYSPLHQRDRTGE
jgi:hypothetical protein